MNFRSCRELLFAVLLALVAATAARAAAPELISNGDFDFYVLTLSWSPGFCDTGGEEKSRHQCAVGAGEGFVVHGLWPENSNRPYPSDCGDAGYIPGAALRETHGLYPGGRPRDLRISQTRNLHGALAAKTISTRSNTRARNSMCPKSCALRMTP